MTVPLIKNVTIIDVREMVHVYEIVQEVVRLDGLSLPYPTNGVMTEGVQDIDLKAIRLEDHDPVLHIGGEVVTENVIEIENVRLEIKMDDVTDDVHGVEA